MNEKIEINKTYEILDGDDDVLLLGKATFMVRRFKELAASKFSELIGVYVVQHGGTRQGIMMQLMTELCINEETKIMEGI